MDTHRPLAELAFEHRVGTIVQKPFAPTLEDCVAMVHAAEAAGVFLAVHENFRFEAPIRTVKDVLDGGSIGAPSWARIAFRTGYDVYRNQPYFYDEERLVILDLGVHVVDVARFLLGEVAHVSCETQRRNPKVRAEDTATMLIRHVSGAVSVVECTYEAKKLPDPFPETLIEIEGPKGAVLLKSGYRMEVTADGAMEARAIEIPRLSWAVPPWHMVHASVHATCAHMLACIRTGQEAETSGRDNLRTYAVCEAAYEAARTGRAVRSAR
jgi:predicted dehydrogenase